MLLSARPAHAQLIPKDMPEPVRGLEIQDKRGQLVPLDLGFFDEQANAVNLSAYFNRPGTPSDGSSRTFNKPVVLLMVYYTCPLQCPQTLEGLHQVLNGVENFTVGSEFDVVIVSFDPRDKPRDATHRKIASLMSYNRPTTDGIRNGWTYLTSSAVSARTLADSIGFPFRFLPESGEFGHPTVVYVLTPEGKVSRQFNGVKFPPRDLRFALMEASSGRIGDTFDRFAFWCYHFDPNSGSYTLQAMRVMQIGAAISAVALGGFLLLLLRFERVKARRLIAERALLAAGAPSNGGEQSNVAASSPSERVVTLNPTFPDRSSGAVGAGVGVTA